MGDSLGLGCGFGAHGEQGSEFGRAGRERILTADPEWGGFEIAGELDLELIEAGGAGGEAGEEDGNGE